MAAPDDDNPPDDPVYSELTPEDHQVMQSMADGSPQADDDDDFDDDVHATDYTSVIHGAQR